MTPKVLWFTTPTGGQVGICRSNIKHLCSEWVMTNEGVKYYLDPNKWAEHRFALVNGCI